MSQRPVRRSLPSSLVISGACCLLAAGATGCDEQTPDGLASLGQFRLCLQKVVDTCADERNVCGGLGFDRSRRLNVAYRREDGVLHLRREGLDVVAGIHQGNRVVVHLPPVEVEGFCRCTLRAREAVQAELSFDPAPACVDDRPEAGGCLPEEGREPVSDDVWLSGGDPAALDPDTFYASVRGRLTTVLEPVGEGCACATPCRIEYDFTGRR